MTREQPSRTPGTTALRERAVSGMSEGPTTAAGAPSESIHRAITESSGVVPSHAPAPDTVRTGLDARTHDALGVEPPPAPAPPPAPYVAAFLAAPLALAVVDRQGQVVTANVALAGMLGGDDPGALRGRMAAELVDLASDSRTWHTYREVLRGRQARLTCTRRIKHADGHSVWVQVTVSPVPGGRTVLLSLTDISARRELQERLRHLQMHDPVTRLPNRTLFFERLSAALEAGAYDGAGTGRIGLCYLDLDGFKAVNDTLGHSIGDRLLTAVAERLTRCADRIGYGRGSAAPLVARLGGDEFALLVEDSAGTEQLSALADSVLRALQEPFDLSGQRLALSASIGVVERRVEGTTATGLMQAADTTLYWAKADGKSRWTLFDPERNAHRMTRQALASSLRPAVERGEFVLEYQPLVNLGDGMLRGVEALVRWNHPQFGMLAPNRFIGLAEEDGSIVQLGRWILRTACRQARRWQLDHPEAPVYVSVNVAVRQVWDSDLVADVAEVLAETGLSPELLQLELTESAVMGSAGRPLQALHALSDMGVHIAIDDFGTGYSNLAYLSRLPVSALKLDGSFVRGFQYDEGAEHATPADAVIVEAMVQLAHRLGLTVTAECVETTAQATRLRQIGCDTGQGWLYSRPVTPDRISALLTAS
ncbi:EAL domain-containing protein [Streptomyces sp. NPDC046821]|uniref:putative bifunctional diguanylate cyclase/phosphodiesterase n=1 Tax=Streptomyces sp. NPDC046821 TaxID=3154702 RepID=UPI0033CAA2E9